VAAAFGMRNQLLHLIRRRRALDVDRECHFLESGSRPFQAKLVGNVEAASHVHLGIFDRHVVQRREPRQLSEKSKCCPDEKVVEGRRTLVRPTSLSGLVAFQSMPANLPFQVHILEDSRYRSKGDLCAGWLARN